jgi:hypothetical protein
MSLISFGCEARGGQARQGKARRHGRSGEQAVQDKGGPGARGRAAAAQETHHGAVDTAVRGWQLGHLSIAWEPSIDFNPTWGWSNTPNVSTSCST